MSITHRFKLTAKRGCCWRGGTGQPKQTILSHSLLLIFLLLFLRFRHDGIFLASQQASDEVAQQTPEEVAHSPTRRNPTVSLVFATLVNDEAATTLLPLFLLSLQENSRGVLSRLTVGVTSGKAQRVCQTLHTSCQVCEKCSSNPRIAWKSAAWKHVTWDKTVFIQQLLEETRTPVFFVDADTVFLRDPSPLISHIGEKKLLFHTDNNSPRDYFAINTGIVLATPDAKSVLREWHVGLKALTPIKSQQQGLYELLRTNSTFKKIFVSSVGILPCKEVFSGCCWRKMFPNSYDEFKRHKGDHSQVSSLLSNSLLFHAACSPPMKKTDRLHRLYVTSGAQSTETEQSICPSTYPMQLSTIEHMYLKVAVRHANAVGAGRYAEFGSGGSTIHIASQARSALSIESHKPLYETMVNLPEVKCLQQKQVRYVFVSAGELIGKEISKGRANQKRYFSCVDALAPRELFDIVFIHGRFGVACALNSLNNTHEESLIVVRDYGKFRHVLDSSFKLLVKVDSLAILRKCAGLQDIDEY